MNTIGNAEFYSEDAEQMQRCQDACRHGREVTETYDTPTGEKSVVGTVASVREEAGPRWRISIRPNSAAS